MDFAGGDGVSETCVWNGGLVPMNVTVIRREGYLHAADHVLPPGYWEARVCDTGTKVLVRPEDLSPAFTITTSLDGLA